MWKWINSFVGGSTKKILKELKLLRKKQPNGVYVDPFFITWGY